VPSPPDPLFALAASQHGVIGRGQAIDLGATSWSIDRAVHRGRLVVAHRGVYRVPGAPVTWRGKLSAACLATDGVASHRSAATLLDVRSIPVGRPELTTSRRQVRPASDLRVHRSVDLHRAEPRMVDGIPTTSAARLAVDLGAVLPESRVESAIHELIAHRGLTWDDVAVAVLRHSRRGRNGVGLARRIVERRHDGLVGDSVFESVLLALLADAELPAPALQVEIWIDGAFVARVDVAWPDRGVIIEADSVLHHLATAAFQADKHKRNLLRLHGWLIHEVTWKMCLDQRPLVERQIRALLESRPPGCFPGVL